MLWQQLFNTQVEARSNNAIHQYKFNFLSKLKLFQLILALNFWILKMSHPLQYCAVNANVYACKAFRSTHQLLQSIPSHIFQIRIIQEVLHCFISETFCILRYCKRNRKLKMNGMNPYGLREGELSSGVRPLH